MIRILGRIGIGILSIFGLGSVVSTTTATESSSGILGGLGTALSNIWNSVFGGFGTIASYIFLALIVILVIKLIRR